MTREQEDETLKENGWPPYAIGEYMITIAVANNCEVSYGEARRELIDAIINANNLGLVRDV